MAIVTRPASGMTGAFRLHLFLWAGRGRWARSRVRPLDRSEFRQDRRLGPVLTAAVAILALEGVLALILGDGPRLWMGGGPPVPPLAAAGGHGGAGVASPSGAPRPLVARDGGFHEIRVPDVAVMNARPRRRQDLGRSGWRLGPSAGEVILAHGDATVTFDLDPRPGLEVDGLTSKVAISSLWLTADDPARFCAALPAAAPGRPVPEV